MTTTTALLEEMEQLYDSPTNRLFARDAGLNITTVAWEDTARNKNSCWGMNISDLTLNTSDKRMPMIRKPNFSDVTGDLDISYLTVTVGNEIENDDEEKASTALRRIPLKDYLDNIGTYAVGGDTSTSRSSLALPRDEVVLCSSQACILPLEDKGEVAFVPELFNYQSTKDNPAVLAIVATSQGTSAHVITQAEQKLYFNRQGQATKFLAKRLSQDRAERNVTQKGEMTTEEQDRNVLVIYQIPLKKQPLKTLYVLTLTGKKIAIDIDVDETVQSLFQKVSSSEGIPADQLKLVNAGHLDLKQEGPTRKLSEFDFSNGDTIHAVLKLRGGRGQTRGGDNSCVYTILASLGGPNFFEGKASGYAYEECEEDDVCDEEFMDCALSSTRSASTSSRRGRGRQRHGMEHAMLRAADTSEGVFEKVSMSLERDERYPIRATFQFYRVTDDAVISKELFSDISSKIESVYNMAKDKGSLVIDHSSRPTESSTIPQNKLADLPSVPLGVNPLFAGFAAASDVEQGDDFVVITDQ